MSRPRLRLVEPEGANPPRRAGIPAEDLAALAASLCTALTAFWWFWTRRTEES